MRRVRRCRREVEEERLPGRRLLLVADHRERLVRQILGEVVAIADVRRSGNGVIVSDKRGRPLVRLGTEEAVVPLEPESQRPSGERTRRAQLAPWDEVPLADRERVVARVAKRGRQRLNAVRKPPGVAASGTGNLGKQPHSHRVVVAAGQQAGACRRAQGGHVKRVEAQAVLRKAVDGRGLDLGTENSRAAGPTG
jgi:hypothetical protein